MSKQALFTPIQIGKHQLLHRIVQSPTTRLRANIDGVPSEKQVEYYSQRANNGGLMITESTFISPLAGGFKFIPGIYTSAQIEGWKRITDAVHAKGGIVFMQLWHVGRVGFQRFNPNNEQVVSASPLRVTGKSPQFGSEYETPHELSIQEIKSIINEYRQAALNAIEAGFDGVEVHAGFGYLVDQFINSASNQRTDEYGGSIENRARFALEVMDAIVGAVGADRAAIRFSPEETLFDVQDQTPLETWGYITARLQQQHPNLAYLHFVEHRANVHQDIQINSEDTLEPYRKIWKGPFITAGGFSTNVEHAFDIAEKTGNLIAFGRAFIANPDLPERLLHGWPLNPYDRRTFYTQQVEGYTDYPFYKP